MKEWLKNPAVLLGLIIGLTIGVYSNSFHNPFQYDDFHSIVNNPHIRDMKKIPTYFFSTDASSAFGPLQSMYRPVLMTTYALNYHWGELKPEGYRVVNLAFHVFSILLVYAMAVRLFNNVRIGLIAALIFAVHPFQSEVVNYISARSSVMATALYLLTVYLFLMIKDPRGLVSEPWIRGGLYLAFLVSFCMAMLTKEISLTLPVILILADILLTKDERLRAFSKNFWVYLPLFMFTLFFMARIDFLGFLKNLRLTSLALQVKILLQTPWLLALPTGLSAHHEFYLATGLFDPSVAIPFFILMGFLTYGVYCAFSAGLYQRITAFLILWYFIVSLPTTLIPLNVAFMEHRGYLPGVGLILLIALAFDRLWLLLKRTSPRPGKYVVYALSIILMILLAGKTWTRNLVWKDEIHLWSDVVERMPNAKLPLLFLGQSYQKVDQLDKSLEIYKKIISEDPKCMNPHPCTYAHLGIGEIYHHRGQLVEAIGKYQEAIRFAPEHYVLRYVANYEIGVAYQELGKYEKAIEAYREALKRNPTSQAAHFALGSVYDLQKQYDLAEKEYEAVLNLVPSYYQARLRLAAVFAQKGLLDQAAQEYQTVLAAEPQNALAYRGLGYVHETQGHVDQAIQHYQSAIALGSDDPGFRFHLGSLYFKVGNKKLAKQQWENAVAQAPDFLEARFSLAKLLQQDGHREEAISQYRQLKAMVPAGQQYQALSQEVEAELHRLEKSP